MKRLILSVFVLLTTISFASAQRASEKKAQIRNGLKEEVKLSDEQINSVMAIEDEFRPKLKAIKSDTNLSEADKKAKYKELNEQKQKKIEAAVGADQAKKVNAFYDTLKKKKDDKDEDKDKDKEKEGNEKKDKKGKKGDKGDKGEKGEKN